MVPVCQIPMYAVLGNTIQGLDYLEHRVVREFHFRQRSELYLSLKVFSALDVRLCYFTCEGDHVREGCSYAAKHAL